MKPCNVRFNPTPNGDLHIGHIYVAMVNWTLAKRTGGKFVLRFDDNQEIWSYRQTIEDNMNTCTRIIEDLMRFGIVPHKVSSQRDSHQAVMATMMRLNGGPITETSYVWSDNSPEVVGNDIAYYAYNYPMTAEKVAWDFMEEINCIVRGEDLITEAALYSHICEKWRLPQPRQIYLPRMLGYDGQELSKTNGVPTIRKMLDSGYSVGDIWDIMAEACLIKRSGEWTLDNILTSPRVQRELS